jgi:hypothetical protein
MSTAIGRKFSNGHNENSNNAYYGMWKSQVAIIRQVIYYVPKRRY